jgi:hypothetical protein
MIQSRQSLVGVRMRCSNVHGVSGWWAHSILVPHVSGTVRRRAQVFRNRICRADGLIRDSVDPQLGAAAAAGAGPLTQLLVPSNALSFLTVSSRDSRTTRPLSSAGLDEATARIPAATRTRPAEDPSDSSRFSITSTYACCAAAHRPCSARNLATYHFSRAAERWGAILPENHTARQQQRYLSFHPSLAVSLT